MNSLWIHNMEYYISKARILEWIATSYSRGSSWPRDKTCISCISCLGRWFFTLAPSGKPLNKKSKILNWYIHNMEYYIAVKIIRWINWENKRITMLTFKKHVGICASLCVYVCIVVHISQNISKYWNWIKTVNSRTGMEDKEWNERNIIFIVWDFSKSNFELLL